MTATRPTHEAAATQRLRRVLVAGRCLDWPPTGRFCGAELQLPDVETLKEVVGFMEMGVLVVRRVTICAYYAVFEIKSMISVCLNGVVGNLEKSWRTFRVMYESYRYCWLNLFLLPSYLAQSRVIRKRSRRRILQLARYSLG